MKNIRLRVNGMHCQSCGTFIREALEGIDGIFAANADLKKGRVDVLFNDEKTSTEKIRKAIEEIGYKAV